MDTVYRPKSGKNAGRVNRKLIEKYLLENPLASRKEIAERLGLSLNTVSKHLLRMRTKKNPIGIILEEG